MVGTTKRLRRIPLAVVLVMGVALSALLMIGIPGEARADTELGHSGYVGPHRLSEPGMGCSRSSSSVQGLIVVSPPKIWARAAYTNGQWVGYQVQIQRYDHTGGGYQVWWNSPIKYSTAYPSRVAPLGRTDIGVGTTGYALNYRAVVYMYWFNNSGYRQGYTVHRVDYYISNGQMVQHYCRI